MDITTSTPLPPPPTTTKSPEDHETETPPRIPKILSFSNGVLKRHHPHTHHHHHQHHQHPLTTNHQIQVTYKECLKNHAATLGGHALDGCGEFMTSPAATPSDPTSIKCAACGCHRNFHRRDADEPLISAVIEFQPHHRHHPPPPPPPPHFPVTTRSPSSSSPPPISSAYYPSAPHMLLALSSGCGIAAAPENTAAPASSGRKRFRTKFSTEQKEKMQRFAEKVGWKMQKRNDDLVQDFCSEIGVDRGVLKVWMHNNKNNFAKRDSNNNGGAVNGDDGGRSIVEGDPNNNDNNNSLMNNEENENNNDDDDGDGDGDAGMNGNDGGDEDPSHHQDEEGGGNVGANGSSSSS